MKGLEVSEVRLSEINLGDRIDADYFTKANLQIDKRLKALHTSELRSFADFVASAFYPAATQLYSIGDTPFIRCVDCIDFPLITKIQDESFEKIPMSFVSENDGINLLKQNDIVITKVGSPCYASIIYEHDVVALSRTVMGLKNVRDINPFYLLIFLRSKYGFLQLLRARELTIQYQLTLERVKRILVFIPDNNFQHSIEIIVKDSIDKLKQSQSLYSEAEEILLTELGLKNWQPDSKAVNVKTLKESFLRTGRLDAEYYQPKYDKLKEKLSAHERRALGDIVSIKKSVEPGSESYQESGIPFIRVSDVSEFGISQTDLCLSPRDFNLEALRPHKDTILLSKDGSICIAYKCEADLDVITSGALLHLTVTDSAFLPDYITLVLNSVVVRMQAERDSNGAIIQHWKPDDIKKVIIPALAMKTQRQIAEKVRRSFALRTESGRLLEQAKEMVEAEIEGRQM